MQEKNSIVKTVQNKGHRFCKLNFLTGLTTAKIAKHGKGGRGGIPGCLKQRFKDNIQAKGT